VLALIKIHPNTVEYPVKKLRKAEYRAGAMAITQ
jgi:hypothetical protein